MSTETDSLREIAEKATPGPWIQQQGRFVAAYGAVNTFDGPVLGAIARLYDTDKTDLEGREWSIGGSSDSNAAFIATFDPPTVLALLAENTALRAANERLSTLGRAVEAERDEALAQLAETRERLERAVEALRPFADQWTFSRDEPDVEVRCATESGVLTLQVAHFRQAFNVWSPLRSEEVET